LEFEWDEAKATSNLAKHGVSFGEALTVFDDSLAAIFDDEAHSSQELREIIIGYSTQDRLVLVCFTERQDVIRLVSARLATRTERRKYEESIHQNQH
jgi:uncharacterized DUF497 family protein